MSRSTGSQQQPGGYALPAADFDVNPDPRAWNPRQAAPAQQPQTQGRPAAPSITQQYADAYGHAGAQGGYYAQQPTPQTAGRAPQPQANSYAPQFDTYVPPPAFQPSAAPFQPAAQMQPRPQMAAPQQQSGYPDLRGATYDQWPQAKSAAPAPTAQPQAEQRGYEFPQYSGQALQQGQGYAAPYQPARPAHYAAQQANPAQRMTAAQAPAQAPMDWGHAAPAQSAQSFPSLQAQQPDPNQWDYGQDNSYAQNGADAYNPEQAGLDAGNDEFEEEAAPRSGRSFMIAATLAGAILVGGGLTYAYNSLLGGGAGGNPPLVKNATGPAKVKPADPGGKQFAHADSKVLGRLTENSASDVDASGAKKVATLVVKPDGSIEPPAAGAAPEAAPAPAPAPPQSNTVLSAPGMSVISVGSPPPLAAAAPAPMPPAEKQAAAAAAAKPAMLTAEAQAAPATPKAAPSAPANALVETAAVAPPAAKKPAAAPAVKKPVAQPAVATTAAPAAAPAVTGAGYMAVVASIPASAKSRTDALARWADMRQKYGSILDGKVQDVQEANLGEKGVYHRLLVGPPGSKDSASSVCSQLKAAGHTDCWVMAY